MARPQGVWERTALSASDGEHSQGCTAMECFFFSFLFLSFPSVGINRNLVSLRRVQSSGAV